MAMKDNAQKKANALEEFYALLQKPRTDEVDWQQFFDKNPFVLTDSLPLRVSNIFSQVQLESGIPDYVFFERQGESSLFDTYGVVELKRPRDKILRVYSTRHIVPSSALNTARFQAERYLNDLSSKRFLDKRISFAIGNAAYCFIIIGRSEEVSAKCQEEIFRLQFGKLLPSGFQVIPYDVLWQRFRSTIPSATNIVFLEIPDMKENIIGSAEVRQVFEFSKGGHAAGCMVSSGRILRGKVRVRRRKDVIYEGITQTLRRFQDVVNEVRAGMECGISIEGYSDFQVGDTIECYTTDNNGGSPKH
jgi:hypothetical protein